MTYNYSNNSQRNNVHKENSPSVNLDIKSAKFLSTQLWICKRNKSLQLIKGTCCREKL